MYLLLISLLSLCITQYIAAAHPDHNSIKFTLMKVSEGKILLDDALEKIVGNDLKIRIIKDTYQKDFHVFFFDVRHLYIFTQPGTLNFSTSFNVFITDTVKKNYPSDAVMSHNLNEYSYILPKIETTYPDLYKKVMAPLEDYKSTLDTYKPTFMCMAGNTAFLANGTDKIIIYDTQEKKTTTFKPRSPIDCISCLAPIKNHDVIKIDTPDIFCSATNCYIIDNTHAEPQTAPIYLKHIYPSQKHKLFLSCMTNTADPSLFCGIKGNKNELLLLQVSGENIKIQPITIPASIESEPIQLENALGLRTIGCRIFVRLSDQNFITVVPYVPNELIKIHFCEFSCAQAAMLYRVIQDKKNETTIASAEEHKAVQELIPDAYAKTLQKE